MKKNINYDIICTRKNLRSYLWYQVMIFKNGMTILYDGHMYKILWFMHVKPGKGGAFVKTKLRDFKIWSSN